MAATTVSNPSDPQSDNLPQTLTVEARSVREFAFSAEAFYDAWLDESQVRSWLSNSLKSFGLPGEMRRVQIDSRLGGRFCFSDLRNGMEAIHHGEYLELNRPTRISFTWIAGECREVGQLPDLANPPSKVTVSIVPNQNGCIATIVHEMAIKWAEYSERTAQGWSRMLMSIERLIADRV